MGFFSKIAGGLGFGGGGRGGGGGDASGAAMQYLNQIPGIVKPYHEPFIKQGQEASAISNPIYKKMAQDPTTFLNQLMQTYSPSEGYKFRQKELTRAAQNSAAQGGFAGTRNDQLSQAELVNGLLNQDIDSYLSKLFGIQGAGLEGQESNTHRGFLSSHALADLLGSNLSQQGGLAFQGQAQRNANRMGRGNALLSLLGQGAQAAGTYYGLRGGF